MQRWRVEARAPTIRTQIHGRRMARTSNFGASGLVYTLHLSNAATILVGSRVLHGAGATRRAAWAKARAMRQDPRRHVHTVSEQAASVTRCLCTSSSHQQDICFPSCSFSSPEGKR
eukprot:1382872-Amphidinium_carterae.1